MCLIRLSLFFSGSKPFSQRSHKARQQNPREWPESWAMGLTSYTIREALGPSPWVIRGQGTVVIWHGRKLAPALPSPFVALGIIRPSSGIIWKLGTKAGNCIVWYGKLLLEPQQPSSVQVCRRTSPYSGLIQVLGSESHVWPELTTLSHWAAASFQQVPREGAHGTCREC